MTIRGALLLAACLTLAPASALAQEGSPGYAPADPQLPLPLGSTRPEDGGLYTFGRFVYFHTNNPLRAELVAVRGFVASDNSIPSSVTPGGVGFQQIIPFNPINGVLNNGAPLPIFPAGTPNPFTLPGITTSIFNNNGNLQSQSVAAAGFVFNVPATAGLVNSTFIAGQFVGSGTEALNVANLNGQGSYQPGFEIGLGWKFRDGSSLSFSWLYITDAQYRAAASLAPQFGQVGPRLADTFLFAPVFNFPPELSGANFKVSTPNIQTAPSGAGGANQPNAQAVFGIWNGASIMTIEFIQRFQQYELNYRMPIYETDDYRVNALVGPRFVWFWDKFKWTTTSLGININGVVDNGPDKVGIYSAITSNRMYGTFVGCEQECYLGHGFSLNLDTRAAMLAEITRERAEYTTAAKFLALPENKRSKSEWDPVPELQAMLSLWWYPTEFIQVMAGYEVMAFFNTRVNRRPIDFNYGTIEPKWTHDMRTVDGFRAGVGITF
jgi:hypothetical protein